MGSKRKKISKKIRFEVFKRDSFTCQYCGRKAPDVVLEVDHIKPIKADGSNDMMNLITSCFDCNRGKGKRELTQKDEIQKQQKMLEELNERREQLEMLLKWKQELEKIDDRMVDEIEAVLSVTGHGFTDYGRKNCRKNIKTFGFDEVYESAKISLDQYYVPGDEDSIKKTFDYIGRICCVRKNQKDNPDMRNIFYLLKIGQNRFSYFNRDKIRKMLVDNYDSEDFEILKDIFSNAYNWSTLVDELNSYFYGDE